MKAMDGEDEDELLEEPDPDLPAEGPRGPLVELMRKVAFAGLGALFMTEEGIRSVAGQLKLPKEALSYALAQAEKTKDEVGRVLSEELRRFLRSENLRADFLQLLAGMSLEVTANVRLVPDPQKPGQDRQKPEVKVTSVRPRASRKKR
jgi:hypothetical protein